MVTYWTGWWNEHRDVLLDGLLEPRQPALLYPVVVASTADKRIVAVYSDVIAEVGSAAPAQLWVVVRLARFPLLATVGVLLLTRWANSRRLG